MMSAGEEWVSHKQGFGIHLWTLIPIMVWAIHDEKKNRYVWILF